MSEGGKCGGTVVEGVGGLILAGGRSRRMGADKATLVFQGEALLDRMRGLLHRAGAAPVLVVGGACADLPDAVAGAGPVAGLCALAANVDCDGIPLEWFVVPVDMPNLTSEVFAALRAAPGDAAHFIGHPLPLRICLSPAVRRVLAACRHELEGGRSLSLKGLLEKVQATRLEAKANAAAFANINTSEDLQRLNDGQGCGIAR